MIQIIPSIWIREGKCVRVKGGDFSNEIVYPENPLDIAYQFQDHGIETLHLVDLDGAQRGDPVNYSVLETLGSYTDLKIDFAGGVGTYGAIDKAFECGASYVTAATVAVYNQDLFANWLVTYGRNKITLGADCLNNKIAIKGWTKRTTIDVFDHIGYFYERGLLYVKTTDVSKDGSLEGPAFDLYKDILDRFPNIRLLASGGVRSIGDIEKLDEMGVYGVIFGKAYFENKLKLEDLKKFLASY